MQNKLYIHYPQRIQGVPDIWVAVRQAVKCTINFAQALNVHSVAVRLHSLRFPCVVVPGLVASGHVFLQQAVQESIATSHPLHQ